MSAVNRIPEASKPEPIPLKDMVNHFKLKSLTPNMDITEIKLPIPEVNKPGLLLSGFYEHYEEKSIQILGKEEVAFLETLSEEQLDKIISGFLSLEIPCIVVTGDLEILPHIIIGATIHGVPVYSTTWKTSEFIGELIRWLKIKLAPRITIHGVLLDIFGEGVILMGDSGIGKSEAALSLVKRGHRLVADDAVEISRIAHGTLIGTCPNVIQYFTEIRGIGIIDVMRMFGVEAVKSSQVIDLILNLEHYDENKIYDRMGLDNQYVEILGHKVVSHTIPVRPGRNLDIICESAAVNNRQKKMGYSAAQELELRLRTILSEG